MSVPVAEQKTLALLSGNLCAFPDCGASLIKTGKQGESVIVGEIAHIVGDSRQGPRGRSTLTEEDRDRADNLIYLCEACHKLVDRHPRVYSVEVLRQMKRDHETHMAKLATPSTPTPEPPMVTETIHSTLLRLAALPARVFSAPCAFVERQEKEVAARLRYPDAPDELVPFILRDRRLFCFHDLSGRGPFSDVVDVRKADAVPIFDFAADSEGRRRVVDLLNRSLRRFLAIRNVGFDPVHKRYFFRVPEPGTAREEHYHTLTGRSSSRNVVWQPIRKATGEPKNHWLHLAAGLRFEELAEDQWGFSIRIERHLTTDGMVPFPAEYVGRKVTRLKARMFNDAYLGEVHFWRDFLSGGKPRFILNFGPQSCIVDSDLVSCPVKWPGIPEDAKPFTNQAFTDDLFSLAEFRAAADGHEAQWELDMEDDSDE
jgi:hypothetical protein